MACLKNLGLRVLLGDVALATGQGPDRLTGAAVHGICTAVISRGYWEIRAWKATRISLAVLDRAPSLACLAASACATCADCIFLGSSPLRGATLTSLTCIKHDCAHTSHTVGRCLLFFLLLLVWLIHLFVQPGLLGRLDWLCAFATYHS